MRATSESTVSSPSDAYAALNLGASISSISEAMSGSQDGGPLNRQRSASPVKRSAALMEGVDDTSQQHATGPAPVAVTAMPNLPPRQDMVSADADMGDGAKDDPPPSYAAAIHSEPSLDSPSPFATALSIDDQVRQILQLLARPLSEGQKGFVVSCKWLGRVLSRSSENPMDREFEKDAAEGDIGSIDNSDILAPAAQEAAITPFETSEHPFVPLRPGLSSGIDYEVFSEEAWKLIVSWYGLTADQPSIIRFAHDTAPQGASERNLIFEVYPPTFTLRKLVSRSNRASSPQTPSSASHTSQANTGANTPEDGITFSSIKIVASRTERFQTFLARGKKAAGIPLKHKVKIWRQLEPAQVSTNVADPPQAGMLTPVTSRSTSPAGQPPAHASQSLVIDPSVFSKWQEGTDFEQVDVQDYTNDDKYNGKATLDTLGMGMDQTLILEEQIRGPAGGEYASDTRRKINASNAVKPKNNSNAARLLPASSAPITRGRTKRDGRTRGTIGLTNLGNTCYMNSALQCISRVEELAVYFLQGKFKEEINAGNPLGYGGKMAKAYADLLAGLYSENAGSAFRPGQFKSALAMSQPMFSGYGQQDSQEFLSFLVDALHEDLNRIQKKPYRENPDSDDNTVHDPEAIKALGEIYRENHQARNDSVAMDLFNGFYKNTMDCPECHKVSVTFDPYSLLTLQLPIENAWHGHIYVVPQKGRPAAFEVDIDKNSSWKAVKEFIASRVEGLSRERMILVETFSHKIYKVFPDTDTIAESGVQSGDILFMYELPDIPTNAEPNTKKRNQYRSIYNRSPEPAPQSMDTPAADRMAVPILHCRGDSRGGSPSFVLNPTFILVTKEEAKDYDAILKKVLHAVATMTSREIMSEFSGSRPVPSSESSAVQSETDTAADLEGRVTDRSIPSEDGYVDVAVQNVAGSNAAVHPDNDIPESLRRLFEIKYLSGGSSDDLFLTGNGSWGSAKSMLDRVPLRNTKKPRRNSVESIHSTTSRESQDSGYSGGSRSASVSDVDEDSPDRIIGGSNNDFASDVHSEDELSQSVGVSSKQSRERDYQRKRNNKKQNYSRKERRNSKQSVRSNNSRASTAQPTSEADEFYIRLGEGIVLDWHEDAFDALFGGDSSSDDIRGAFTMEPKTMPVFDDPQLRTKLQRRSQRSKNGISLEDCFAETGKTEILSEENAWYCNRCKELRRASKTLEIWTAPDILVVHLKRFSGERYRRDKVDVLVDFPLEGLDLTERVGCKEDGKEYVYDLFAVDNHYGGLGGGHYTAYAKNFFDGKWYDFNGTLYSQEQTYQDLD